jgi:paraquat-inducible protein B
VADPDLPLAEPLVAQQNRLRLSLVWLVPIVALVVGAALVARSFLQSGPEITIEFRSAEGLEAGRTEVRFKEVAVGRVTRIGLKPDRQKVIVSVRLDKSVANIAVEDTRFWVVRPRIGSAGISGLGTLLSGSYIGVDAGASEESRREFLGLDAPPLLLRGEPGRSFVLDATDLGSLDVGAPVFFRRIRAGRVVGYALDPVTKALSVRIFIEAPHEALVTQATRFWHSSGVDLTLNAGGLTVNAQSLTTVLAGGVAFDYGPDGGAGTAAAAGDHFRLYAGEKAARASDDGEPLRVRMVFDQSLRGLEAGAPIDLLGIELGSVRDIALQVEPRSRRLPIAVTADLYPKRMGRLLEEFRRSNGQAARADARLIARLVEQGLRAQVRSGNLLTGSLYIALDFVPKAPRARFDIAAAVPTLPTVPGAFSDMQTQLAETVDRLSKVRFDEIGRNLNETLKSAGAATAALQLTLEGADQTIRQLGPDAQRSLAGLRETLVSAQRALDQAGRNLTADDAPLQRQTQQTLAELQRAAQAMRVLADYLQRHPESLLRGKPDDPPVPRNPESKP